MTGNRKDRAAELIAECDRDIAVFQEMREFAAHKKAAVEKVNDDFNRLNEWLDEGTEEGLQRVETFLNNYVTK